MSRIQRTAMSALLVCILLSVTLFFSCADKIKTNIIVFEALDEGLVNSNISLDKGSQVLYASLEQKTTEPATAEKAKVWYQKAQLIQKLSKETYSYIEELRSDLKKEAGLKTNDTEESFKESDKTAVMRLFEKKEKAEELHERLKKYKRDIIAVDEEIVREFNSRFFLTTPEFDAATEIKDFYKTFFHDIPTAAALAMLSKFQNNIKVNENRMVAFCNSKVGSFDGDDYYTYSFLAILNSSYVKAGEELEITAGVGSFSRAAMPVIIINGKNVSLDVDGASHYKFKASDKPGKHVVPVEINFTDQEGKKQTISKNIEYTVADL